MASGFTPVSSHRMISRDTEGYEPEFETEWDDDCELVALNSCISELSTACSTPQAGMSGSKWASRTAKWTEAGHEEKLRVRFSDQAGQQHQDAPFPETSARISNGVRSDEMVALGDEVDIESLGSSMIRLQRQCNPRAQENSQKHLQTVLASLVNEHVRSYAGRCKHLAEESRRSEILGRQQRSAEQLVEDKRQIRNRRALENAQRRTERSGQRRQRIAAHTRRENARTEAIDLCVLEKRRSATLSRSMHDDSAEAIEIVREEIKQQQARDTYDVDALWDLVGVLVHAPAQSSS